MLISTGQWLGAYEDVNGVCFVELDVLDGQFVLRQSNSPELRGELETDREVVLTDAPRTTLSYDCGRALVCIDNVGTVVLKKVRSESREPMHGYEQTSDEAHHAFQISNQVTQYTNHFFVDVWHLFSGWLLKVSERTDWPFPELSMSDVCDAIFTFHAKGDERFWCGKIQRSDDCTDVVETVCIRSYKDERPVVTLDMFLSEMLDRRFLQNVGLLRELDIDEAKLIAYITK